MIRSGSLRQQVVIERFSSVADAYGEEIKSWAVLNTVRANVKPMNGKEEFDIQIDNNEFLLNELSRVKWQIHKIKNTSQERISTSCSAHCFTVSQSQCDHRAIKS